VDLMAGGVRQAADAYQRTDADNATGIEEAAR
jgi:hypothetical protein